MPHTSEVQVEAPGIETETSPLGRQYQGRQEGSINCQGHSCTEVGERKKPPCIREKTVEILINKNRKWTFSWNKE